MNTTTLQIRIGKKEKEETRKVFEKLGLNISTATRMFFRQAVLTKSLPLEVSNKEIEEFGIDKTKIM